MSSPSTGNELSDKLVNAALTDPAISAKGFDSSRVFALISVLLNSPSAPKKQLIRQMGTVYQFKVTNAEGEERTWFVDMKKTGKVGLLEKGKKAPSKPGVTISLSDKDLVGLASGQLMPQKLFAAKRIHVKGNIENALKVEKILSYERQKLTGPVPGGIEKPKERGGRWTGVSAAVKSKL